MHPLLMAPRGMDRETFKNKFLPEGDEAKQPVFCLKCFASEPDTFIHFFRSGLMKMHSEWNDVLYGNEESRQRNSLPTTMHCKVLDVLHQTHMILLQAYVQSGKLMYMYQLGNSFSGLVTVGFHRYMLWGDDLDDEQSEGEDQCDSEGRADSDVADAGRAGTAAAAGGSSASHSAQP